MSIVTDVGANVNYDLQGDSSQNAAFKKFFDDIYEAIARHIDFDKIKAVIIGRFAIMRRFMSVS
jgi:hypothetical protein